jgi:multimeric flavodoxin WrbA
MKVLGISTSPRIKGNTDLLLREALAGAESAGAQTEYLRVCDLNIAPCVECNSCYKTGRCRVEDDYHMVLAKILDADRLIFATPIFFMSVCAQAKILIDRGQAFWAAKYILKKPPPAAPRDCRAMVIAVGGSRSTKMFESVRLTMKTYFDSLGIHYAANLFANQIDSYGAVKDHPSALNEAHRLARELTTAKTPPEKPTTIQLT